MFARRTNQPCRSSPPYVRSPHSCHPLVYADQPPNLFLVKLSPSSKAVLARRCAFYRAARRDSLCPGMFPPSDQGLAIVSVDNPIVLGTITLAAATAAAAP